MRQIDYKVWHEQRRQALLTAVRLKKTKVSASRPRDAAKRELLLEMDRARLEKWLSTGRLKKLAARRYRIDTSVRP